MRRVTHASARRGRRTAPALPQRRRELVPRARGARRQSPDPARRSYVPAPPVRALQGASRCASPGRRRMPAPAARAMQGASRRTPSWRRRMPAPGARVAKHQSPDTAGVAACPDRPRATQGASHRPPSRRRRMPAPGAHVGIAVGATLPAATRSAPASGPRRDGARHRLGSRVVTHPRAVARAAAPQRNPAARRAAPCRAAGAEAPAATGTGTGRTDRGRAHVARGARPAPQRDGLPAPGATTRIGPRGRRPVFPASRAR